MIKRLSHCTAFVTDQARAKEFYTEKLGMEVRADITMGPFRWLTVGSPTQPDLELVLMPVGSAPGQNDDDRAALKKLVEKGAVGVGVFATDDCHKSYAELSAKGVRFAGPPEERPYGVEATLFDDSGNMFSLTQRRS